MEVVPLHWKRLDLRVARMTMPKITVPFPVGDLEIVSPISTFVLNTLMLK